MTDITLIYCPFPSTEIARGLAHELLEEKLVACCNISAMGESLYYWEGVLVTEAEAYMICKTTKALAKAATAKIASLHPAECPAILTFDAAANSPFATWVKAQTRK